MTTIGTTTKECDPHELSVKHARYMWQMLETTIGTFSTEEREQLYGTGMALFRSMVLVEMLDHALTDNRLRFPGALRHALEDAIRHELALTQTYHQRFLEWVGRFNNEVDFRNEEPTE